MEAFGACTTMSESGQDAAAGADGTEDAQAPDGAKSNAHDAGSSGDADATAQDGTTSDGSGSDADATLGASGSTSTSGSSTSSGSTSGSSSSSSSGSSSSVDGGGDPACAPVCAGKICGGACVQIDDPNYGCTPTSCAACPVTGYDREYCIEGQCTTGGSNCLSGFADCDGNVANGCETDLNNPATCGSCTNSCPDTADLCQNGKCVPVCTAPMVDCNGSCRDESSDIMACGSCTACPQGNGTPSCNAGVCSISCDPGFSNCGATTECFETDDDVTHCGSSCTACAPPNNACVEGQCTFTCQPPNTDCSGNCVNLYSTDTNNCGACGNACSSTQICFNGVCLDNTIDLSGGVASPSQIVVDANNLYYLQGSEIWQADKTTLAPTQLTPAQSGLGQIAVGPSNVYWTINATQGVVYSVPIGGGTPTALYSGDMPSAIIADDTYLYWSDYANGGQVYKAPLDQDAGGPVVLAHVGEIVPYVHAFVQDAGGLYGITDLTLTNPRAWIRVDKSTGEFTVFYEHTNLESLSVYSGIALSSANVYFGYNDGAGAAPPTLASVGATLYTGPSGSTDVPQVWGFDTCSLYWSVGGSIIKWAVEGNGSAVTLGLQEGTAIAFDAQYLYYSTGSSIGRLPKY